ncbi:MAG: YfhO family protein [Limisphaerales bacterium]
MNMDAQDAGRGFEGWFSAGKLLLLLGLLLLVFFPGILLGTSAFFYRDAGLFSYPVADYLRESVRAGQWPLWNPYNNCGLPFLAQWNTLALYPPSLIYVTLPFPWSLNVFLLAHLLWGGLGAYMLGRRWFGSCFGASVAGLAFAWNGLSLHCLMWPCHIAALAWMPWVIFVSERAATEGGRALFWTALAGACQLTTGSPEVILFTWLIAAGNVMFDTWRQKRRWLTAGWRFLLAALLATAVSAAQLLPWLDLMAHSDRSSSFGGTAWSLPLWGVANFFVPLFHAQSSLSGVFMQAEQQWTSSYYLGVLPLLLAVAAMARGGGRVIFLVLAAVGGVWLALGDAGLVLPLFKRAIPLLGFSRYPVKFIVLTVFAFSLLAGAGGAWLQSQAASASRRGLLASGALLGLGILLVLAMGVCFPFATDSLDKFWPNTLARLAVLAGGVALLMLPHGWNRPSLRLLPAAAFLVLAGVDVGIHAPPQNPMLAARAYAAYPPAMTALPKLGEARAMLSPEAQNTMDHLVNPDPLRFYLGQRAELFSDCNLLERIPKVDGFFSLHLAWEQKVADLLRGGKAGAKLPEFLGVAQVASPNQLFVWEERTNFMPFATIGQKAVFMDDRGTLEALESNTFAPRQTVYLPSAASGQVRARADAGARVLSSRITPAECLFETAAEGPAMLVVAQSYYHCWKATVDGQSARLWRANYAFQAVEVPAGRHEVRLIYQDRAFWAGAAISIAALGVCVAGCLRSRRQTVQGAR